MKVESKSSQLSQPELYSPVFSESWPQYILYDLAEWINGMAFRGIEFAPIGKPVIKIVEIKNGITSQTQFTSHNYDPIYHITRGDMLFCWSGQPETSIDVFWWNGPDGWLNQHIFKVLPNEICGTQFLYYILKYLKPHFIRMARNKQTTGLGHVTKEDIKNTIVRVPDKPLQSAIVSVLQPFDDKVSLLRRQNMAFEKIAQTTFKEWFVNFKVQGEKLKNDDSTNLPKGWRIGELGEILTLAYGKALKDEQRSGKGYPVIGSSGIVGYHKEYLVKGFGIVVGRKGSMGSVIWIEDNFFPIDTTFYVVDKLGVSNLYFHYLLLKAIDFQRISSDSAVPGLNRNLAYSLELAVPQKEVIEQYNKTVEPIFQKVKNNNSQIQTLSRLRDLLLPKLMKGEIRVKS